MNDKKILDYIQKVLENRPAGWLDITTHRLDIYEEELAKVQFLEQLEALFEQNKADKSSLDALPTAYDYIRLGHPLSCVLEWGLAQLNGWSANNVISFSSRTMPILAVLRKNALDGLATQMVHVGALPSFFDAEVLQQVYGYELELKQVTQLQEVSAFEGSTIFIAAEQEMNKVELPTTIDFYLTISDALGSIIVVNGEQNKEYVGAIQHVRRRESIAMTPADCLTALELLTGKVVTASVDKNRVKQDKALVLDCIKDITGTTSKPLLGSSGLSIQYAIMMGLIDNALEHHQGKAIKIIVPPNCYGGTNDQARRVAAVTKNVEIVDLPVDGDNDMVQSINIVLDRMAEQDAVPYIIAEIPTNPRVEVPDLEALEKALTTARKTPAGKAAIEPVFILDQTFCPNVQFLGEDEILSTVQTISYASGSKFPSGGRCTAGYCVGNKKVDSLMNTIEKHLELCDNEATNLQVKILAEQLPSMKQRIQEAYENTRDFVNFIQETLPAAKINFVSEELASQGFTPSVFSLDLPTKGSTEEEKEAHKRELNYKLINRMIEELPQESKFCVSYGQLKGCYWTIPATSTQGTTKEGDKDYIVRASLSPNLDLEGHKKVFLDFVEEL